MSDEPDSGRADGQNPLENTGAQESSMEREPATPDAIASEQQAKERSTRPGLVMLSGLLVAVAAFGTTLLTWVDARITGAFGEQSLAVSGSKAAPAVSALALVALAAPLAGRIAPRLLRYVVYGVAAAAGVGIVLSVIAVTSNPAAAVVTETSRLTGTISPAGEYVLSPWPWVSAACGVLIIVVALWAAFTSRTWDAGRRYERSAARSVHTEDGHMDEMDAWDSLSRGEDPTTR